MAYPSAVGTYTNPNPSDKLNSPSHSSIESSQNTGLTEIQTFVGTLSSAVGTLVYDIRASASNGGGHVQTAVKGGTGQTSFTKGDVLIAQSSSVLSKLAVGTDGYSLLADSSQAVGVKWGIPSLVTLSTPTVRVYNTASTLQWVKPANISYIIVEVLGAGGGGGGVNAGGAPGAAAGGGGSGAWSRKIINASLITGATASVVVGAAGTGAAAGDNDGVAGGNSSFTISASSSVLCTGGALGGKGTANSGGNGGTATGGDLNVTGGKGGKGFATAQTTISGRGGDSQSGQGGYMVATGDGVIGAGYGSGGSGGSNVSATAAGGDGMGGYVIITEVT